MANRRMFAKTIVLSDAFLDMPLSTRCLYFTLGMVADDEGFVGAPKAIMRQCGASQDDMLILLQKRYVLEFDTGVIVIKHWKMNNYLQSDRIIKTTYLEELAQLSIDDKGAYTEKPSKIAGSECIQNVYTVKNSIDKNSKENNIREITELYNAICTSLPKVTRMSDKRKRAIHARLEEHSVDELKEAFEKAQASEFLTGKTGWKANFDWLMNESNLLKVLEGNYDGTSKKSNKFNEGVETRKYDFEALEREAYGV